MHIDRSLTLFCITMAIISVFSDSEVMTSFTHNLILNSHPRFGFTQSEFLVLHKFKINKRIFMKIDAKCSAFFSPSYQVQVKVCNPIPLITLYQFSHSNVQTTKFDIVVK